LRFAQKSTWKRKSAGAGSAGAAEAARAAGAAGVAEAVGGCGDCAAQLAAANAAAIVQTRDLTRETLVDRRSGRPLPLVLRQVVGDVVVVALFGDEDVNPDA